MVALLDDSEHHGKVFNVGSNHPMSITALAEFVRNELGGDSEIRNVPYEEAFSDGFDDLQAREPDLKRVKDAIGFEPRIGLDQTVRDLADSIGRGKVRG
jgi:UDP-glucose 4-epimerase